MENGRWTTKHCNVQEAGFDYSKYLFRLLSQSIFFLCIRISFCVCRPIIFFLYRIDSSFQLTTFKITDEKYIDIDFAAQRWVN